METSHRFLAFCLMCVALVIGPCLSFIVAGPMVAIVVTLGLLGLTALLRGHIFGIAPGAVKVQVASLAIIASASTAFVSPPKPVDEIIKLLVTSASHLFGLQPPDNPHPWFASATFILVSLTVIVLNIIWFRSHITTPPDVSRDTNEFPTKDFIPSLKRYCNALIRDLDYYDKEVNWSDSELTPLDAEIETDRRGSLRPRLVKDLVKAIPPRSKNRTFLTAW